MTTSERKKKLIANTKAYQERIKQRGGRRMTLVLGPEPNAVLEGLVEVSGLSGTVIVSQLLLAEFTRLKQLAGRSR
jgi:hypothetical protein